MTLILEFVEALGDAKEAAETVDEVGQPGVGDPQSTSDRETAGRAIRLIQLNQNKLTPLLDEEKHRSEAIQSLIRALQEEQEQLDFMREESKEVLETLGILDQQIRQNDFSSGEDEEEVLLVELRVRELRLRGHPLHTHTTNRSGEPEREFRSGG